jgi:Fe-S-cluster containining protein
MHNCDGCTACCKVLKIRELDKPAHAWCQHCQIGKGCGIYETRPESCRIYECIWLQTQHLPKPIPCELRPDKSKVVIGTINHGEELVFYVSPDRPNAWNHGNSANLLPRCDHLVSGCMSASGKIYR